MSIFAANTFANDHIVVTGATGGIGYVTAMELLKTGAKVTACGRNEEKLNKLKQSAHYQAEGSHIHIVAGDLNNPEDREKIVQEARTHFGEITGLVNAAGITGGDLVEKIEENEIIHVLETNFTSQVMLSQLIYKEMKKERRGNIVNVSSLSGLRGTYGNTAYSGSKFALIGFTQSFALEAIEYGIRVNAVCPGFVDTEMARDILDKKAFRAGITYDEQLEAVKKDLPSGRITTPEEVASAILYLLSGASGNIVGESLKISGGSVMR
ncbi:MAG: SDR family oxidoreductase [Alkalicoccus sp.]|nr:MAG: SDR family oxidoreductase [Alkalicoccus sp.]